MKISLVGPVYPYRGGIAHSHALLAQALAQSGHQVQILSFHRQYPAWLYPGQNDRDPSQNHVQLAASYQLDPLYPWTWQSAVREIRAFQPELVLFQWWTVFWAPAFAWMASRLRHAGLHSAFFIHNVIPHEPRRFDPWLARLALNQAGGYITLTEREGQRLSQLLPGLKKPVLTSPLPAYQFATQTVLSKAEARERLHLPAAGPILLFFGLVRPYKGLADLVEALGRLVDHPSKPFLAIAGEFWEDPKIYRDQISRLGLEQRVRIENRYLPDEEAVLWFRAADLFVAPYTGGTQSAALRIALGYGLPVIATDVITQELTGLDPDALMIVPSGDFMTLAEAIQAWLGKPVHPGAAPRTGDEWEKMVTTIELAQHTLNLS